MQAPLPWEIVNSSVPTVETVAMPVSISPIPVREHDLKNAASQAEYETIMNVLKQVNFNKTKAAELLKIDRKTLYNKLRSYESQT